MFCEQLAPKKKKPSMSRIDCIESKQKDALILFQSVFYSLS